MPTIAVIQRKGGVGKTTLTANLAVELAAAGQRVAALDLDAQESLTRWSRRGPGRLADIVRPLALTDDRDNRPAVVAAIRTAQAAADVVLLDTAPSFDALSAVAAVQADLILIPCPPSLLDLETADDVLRELGKVRAARKEKGGAPLRMALVPSRFHPNRVLGGKIHDALSTRGELVTNKVHEYAVTAEAAVAGLAVCEYAAKSDAATEWRAFASLVGKIL